MRQTSFASMHCSLARSLEVIGDWWSPLILRDLAIGPRRFDELAADLSISRNLLTTRLEGLIAAGVIGRSPYQDHPPRYRYHLAEAGLDLVPALMALTAWGDRWATPEGGPPVRYRHRDCGRVFTPTVSCPSCQQAVTADEVDVLPGPGARRAPGTMLAGEFILQRLEPGADHQTGRQPGEQGEQVEHGLDARAEHQHDGVGASPAARQPRVGSGHPSRGVITRRITRMHLLARRAGSFRLCL